MGDYISRQAAIDAIDEPFRDIFARGNGESIGEKLLSTIPSVDIGEDEWIPVVERLPEAETLVWMTTTWGGVAVGFRRAGNEKDWRGGFSSFYTCKDIIAWMPLKRPEPYKGG